MFLKSPANSTVLVRLKLPSATSPQFVVISLMYVLSLKMQSFTLSASSPSSSLLLHSTCVLRSPTESFSIDFFTLNTGSVISFVNTVIITTPIIVETISTATMQRIEILTIEVNSS